MMRDLRPTPVRFSRPLVLVSLAAAVLLVGCFDLPSKPDADADVPFEVDVNLDLIEDSSAPDADTQDTTPPGDTDIDETRSTTVAFDGGELTVELERLRWRIQPRDTAVRSRPRSSTGEQSLAVEYVPDSPAVAETFYDPRPAIEQPAQQWRVVDVEQSEPGEALVIRVEDPAAPEHGLVRIEFRRDDARNGLLIDVVPEPPDDLRVARVEFLWVDDGGPLYGTGLRYDSANGRGKLRPLFEDDDAFQSSGTNRADVPVPFVFNPRGYGLFVDSLEPGAFDLGVASQYTLRARFDAPELHMHLWVSADPLFVMERFARRTALPRTIPRWALAPHFESPPGSTTDELLADADALRQLDVPAGALWLTTPWQRAVNDVWPDPALVPDPAALVDGLATRGFDLVAWTAPYLEHDGASAALYDTAAAAGHLVEDRTGAPIVVPWRPGQPAGVLDATDAGAVARWQELARPLVDLGVRGVALERTLDLPVEQLSTYQTTAGDALTQSGFATATAAMATELLDDRHPEAGLSMSTSAGPGGQAETQAIWADPLDATSGAATASSPGGMRAAMVAMTSLGTSGFPVSGASIGARFDPERPGDTDLLLRWTGLAVASPMLHVKHDQLPWRALDAMPAATRDALRELLALRVRLSPYLELLLEQAAERGIPLVRPVGLMYPDDTEAWQREDTFMLGRDLLVAPVFEPGAARRAVFLPNGGWRNWTTGQGYNGRQEVVVDTPRESLTMFAREGSIIPMRLDLTDTLRDEAGTDVVTPERADATMHLRAFGFVTSGVTLPDGAQVSFGLDGSGRTNVSFIPGPTTRTVYIELVGETPASFECGGFDIPADGSVALVPVENGAPSEPAYRPLTNGALIRMSRQETCSLTWL